MIGAQKRSIELERFKLLLCIAALFFQFVKCSKCELKAWCRGCPAVANGTSGNFYEADPQCWKTKNEITGEILEER